MDGKGYCEEWLEGTADKDNPKSAPPAELPVDIYAEAVAKGLAAQASLQCGKTEPKWLKLWVAKLTPGDDMTIRARQNKEQAGHQEDLERLLGDDMTKWTEAERAHAETAGRRLSAVALVLRARDEAAPFLPMEATAAATAAA